MGSEIYNWGGGGLMGLKQNVVENLSLQQFLQKNASRYNP